MKRKILWILMISLCLGACEKKKTEEEPEIKESEVKRVTVSRIDELPDGDYQKTVTFPDSHGYTDDTLVMNATSSFVSYADQGILYLDVDEKVQDFDLYINEYKIEDINESGIWQIDYSMISQNGNNSLFIGNIEPYDQNDLISVHIPYPVVIEADNTRDDPGDLAFELIDDIISCDHEYGFPSSALAVIRNGKLIYSKAWGVKNSFAETLQEADSATMYDLASVTKMFSVNYGLQKLISEGKLNLDDKIYEYLGESFYEDVLYLGYSPVDLSTQKEWKAQLKISDLLKHEGGFPADPRYFDPNADFGDYSQDEDGTYVLFSGNDHSPAAKEKTLEMICRTPLMYKPGSRTLYSDADYMILGFVIEKISGMDLDSYLKETFFEPLGLQRISYVPLEKGFSEDDCAATEHYGNTRDNNIYFEGIREYTLQGEVHDEKAWYSMAGISGHAGLFSSAEDLAKLAWLMVDGGYDHYKFFDQAVIDLFTSPKNLTDDNWGLGWYREGDDRRSWYFSDAANSSVVGHQGWTGTLAMIDRQEKLVIIYLTSQINSDVFDDDGLNFKGRKYTAASLGFIPQLLYLDLNEEKRNDLLRQLCIDSIRLAKENNADQDDPLYLNALSKLKTAEKYLDKQDLEQLKTLLES